MESGQKSVAVNIAIVAVAILSFVALVSYEHANAKEQELRELEVISENLSEEQFREYLLYKELGEE